MIRGAELGLEIIPAVELSAGLEIEELHVLGYFIDHRNPELLEALDTFRQHRVYRAQKMIALLKDLGIPADYNEFSSEYQSNAIGRLHLAQYLIAHRFVGSIEEVFDQYLGFNKPAYIEKAKLTPHEACDLIHAAGGIVIDLPTARGTINKQPRIAAKSLFLTWNQVVNKGTRNL